VPEAPCRTPGGRCAAWVQPSRSAFQNTRHVTRIHEINVLTKRRHSKWFDSRASGLVRDVYLHCFPASPIVTKRAVRKCKIVHVLWAEANGVAFAAAMVARTSHGATGCAAWV
jgi:hypothetical protein